jgi:hypothetical protein
LQSVRATRSTLAFVEAMLENPYNSPGYAIPTVICWPSTVVRRNAP